MTDPSSSPPRVAFVTGGTGFVGSHLVEELLRRGFEVRTLVRKEPKWLERLPVSLVRGDLFDEAALRAGMAGADLIFHVAGLTRARTQEELDRANVDGTVNVLAAAREAAPDVQRVVVTSSLAAVGPSPVEDGVPRAVTEADPLRPISQYGISKARMEEIIRERFEDLPLVIARPPAVYGPREADIYTIIRTAAKQRLFPIVSNGGHQSLSLVHVRDLVAGLAEAAEAEGTAGRTYFLGSEEAYAWDEVRDVVLKALGVRALKLNVPPALVTPVGTVVELAGRLVGTYPALNREKAREAREAWICSVDRARADFGYRQRVGLREGMEGTIAWYRAEGWL
jgi:dihydroflavonol-4-reductase